MFPILELENVLSASFLFFSENIGKIGLMPSFILFKIRRCKESYEKVNLNN
jgi:hypothetical protein